MSARLAWLAGLALGLGALSGCGGSGGGDEVLATFDFHGAGSGFTTVASHFELRLSFSDDVPYESLAITPPLQGGENGTSYETRASDSATAASVLSLLANGANEIVALLGWYLRSGGGGGSTASESALYDTRHPDLAGTDLVGATVTRLVVRIDTCTFVAGDPHSYDVTGTVVVMGKVD